MKEARSVNPGRRQHIYVGIFLCPGCAKYQHIPLELSLKQIEMSLRFWGANRFFPPPPPCPECNRPMWIEKVINRQGDVVFDSGEWMDRELERLRIQQHKQGKQR